MLRLRTKLWSLEIESYFQLEIVRVPLIAEFLPNLPEVVVVCQGFVFIRVNLFIVTAPKFCPEVLYAAHGEKNKFHACYWTNPYVTQSVSPIYLKAQKFNKETVKCVKKLKMRPSITPTCLAFSVVSIICKMDTVGCCENAAVTDDSSSTAGVFLSKTKSGYFLPNDTKSDSI